MSRPEPPVMERQPVRDRPATRLFFPLISVVALFLIVMFAAASQGLPQFSAAPQGGTEESYAPTAPPAPSAPPSSLPEPPEDSLLLTIIGIIMAAIVGAVILIVLYLGLRLLIRYLAGLWRDRPLARREAAEIDATPITDSLTDVEPDVGTMRRGIAEALRTIGERPDPGDSIIAAWVGLEETASDAGTGRDIHETPSEFTVRIVGSRAGIAGEVSVLLGLYERVRFGGHIADEDDRRQAAVCLSGIQRGWR